MYKCIKIIVLLILFSACTGPTGHSSKSSNVVNSQTESIDSLDKIDNEATVLIKDKKNLNKSNGYESFLSSNGWIDLAVVFTGINLIMVLYLLFKIIGVNAAFNKHKAEMQCSITRNSKRPLATESDTSRRSYGLKTSETDKIGNLEDQINGLEKLIQKIDKDVKSFDSNIDDINSRIDKIDKSNDFEDNQLNTAIEIKVSSSTKYFAEFVGDRKLAIRHLNVPYKTFFEIEDYGNGEGSYSLCLSSDESVRDYMLENWREKLSPAIKLNRLSSTPTNQNFRIVSRGKIKQIDTNTWDILELSQVDII